MDKYITIVVGDNVDQHTNESKDILSVDEYTVLESISNVDHVEEDTIVIYLDTIKYLRR